MTGWIQNMDIDARQISINQASLKSGLKAVAIEKDWWVTLVLKLLFTSKYASFFTFKGGTSLSKGWSLIDRFSEDIDIALQPEAFGNKSIANPTKSYVKQLRRSGCLFTSTDIVAELKAQFGEYQIPEKLYSVEAEPVRPDMPDTDPQTIYVKYQSLFDPNPYLQDRVKIEFSIRSQNEPNESREIHTLLHHYFPNGIYGEDPFRVSCIRPERTMIEKILLLHEEYNREAESKMRTFRMSRHYYDLYRIYQSEEHKKVMSDTDFINGVIDHRKSYSRLRHFDYDTLKIGKIALLPSKKILDDLRADYREMSREMMYGDVPDFDRIISTVLEIQHAFNQKA